MRQRIRVDPTRCDGYGYCAELFPERIRLDDWGYPMLSENPFGSELEPHARRAVRDCPRLALFLQKAEPKSKGEQTADQRPRAARTR
jgi:ferredoxin